MPRTLTSIVVHHSSASTSHSGPIGPRTPALLTSTSIGPSCSRSAATAARNPAASVTSADAAAAMPPADSISSRVSSSSSPERATRASDGAVLGEPAGQPPADAAPGAGDEDDGAVEIGVVVVMSRIGAPTATPPS